MEAVGISVESVHTELGRGMVEFALAHAPALEAADQAARAKAYLKELCGERDLVATFMPKWRTGAPTSGCHFHQSLWRDGVNMFAGPSGGLSPLARHYLAGQLATLRDFSLLLNPSVNAYRRLQPGNFTPATASWGVSEVVIGLEAVADSGSDFGLDLRPFSSSSIRFPHRCHGPNIAPQSHRNASLPQPAAQ